MELEGNKGLLVMGQSRRTWSVATDCLRLADFSGFRGCFGQKKAVLGAQNEMFWEGTLAARGAVAPSRKVPSQMCAVLGQKQPFFAQNSPSKGSKQPNEGKRLLHSTCVLTFS